METTIEFLATLSRFKNLSQSDLADLKSAARVSVFPIGKDIFVEGQQAQAFFVAINGYVKVAKNFEAPRILHIFGPGESFGELALIKGTMFPASATALTDTRVLIAPKSAYDRMRETSLTFAREVAFALANRPGFLTEAIANFSDGNLPNRLKRVFEELFTRFGSDLGDKIELPFYLSRKEIASVVNARHESVSRELTNWEKTGWLVPTKTGFVATKDFFRAKNIV